MNEWTKLIIEAGEATAAGLTGKFNPLKALDLLSVLVERAEDVAQGEKMGPLKHQMVSEAFTYFDQKYRLIARLDELIKLPWYAEPFDSKLIRFGVDILISQAVSMMNRGKKN